MAGSIDENRKEIDLLRDIFSILVVIFQNCSLLYQICQNLLVPL